MYFDYNATTPVDASVFEEMKPFFFDLYGNPSSHYGLGQKSARALNQARKRVRDFLGAREESEIIFTSGGTEANNAALGAALELYPKKNEIVTLAVEHASVLKPLQNYEKNGYLVHYLPIEKDGSLNFKTLMAHVNSRTALVSIMMANNETGNIYPIQKIGEALENFDLCFHVDGVQAAGKVHLQLKDLNVDFFTVSAHKFYGPKGVGVLYARNRREIKPLIFGGSQERRRRAGTENVPGIVGLGKAAELLVESNLKAVVDKVASLRADFEQRLKKRIPDIEIHANDAERICSTSNVAFSGVNAESLVIALDQENIYVSKGSACMSGAAQPSHVLLALGLDESKAKSSLRFSFGKYNSQMDIEMLVERLDFHVKRIRENTAVAQER